MLKKICLCLLFVCLLTVNCSARRIVTPVYVDDAQSLEFWLRGNFTYQDDPNEYWKQPHETIADFGGDCEDFAILTNTVFREIFIPSSILLIYFDDMESGHAITIFKEQNGKYSYMSNQYYVPAKTDTVEELLNKYWTSWYKAEYSDDKRNISKVIERYGDKNNESSKRIG